MTEGKRTDLLGKVIGSYKILDFIAEGGFGRTYRGEHQMLKTDVCIKHGYLSNKDQKTMMEEAAVLWNLRHYGIPVIRDVYSLEDKTIALIMSYIPGPTLEVIRKTSKKLDPEDVAWITERSLNVLRYLHYNGVVHGDVKPQNIIVQPEVHNLVLLDYGFSTIRPKGNELNKGYTPYFSPPEQIAGKTLLPESDFYGLGMTMLYCLGGDVIKKEFPDDVPEKLTNFIKKLIVRDVLSRPRWEEEDLVEKLAQLRVDVFGRRHSSMKSIKGWSQERFLKEKLKGGES